MLGGFGEVIHIGIAACRTLIKSISGVLTIAGKVSGRIAMSNRLSKVVILISAE